MAKMKRCKDPAWEKKYHRRPRIPQPPKVVPQGWGPITYCPACGRQTGTYGSPDGKGQPKPGKGLCPACRQRIRAVYGAKPSKPGRRIPANPRLKEASSKFQSSSVHTASGGLPTLGKRHKLFGPQLIPGSGKFSLAPSYYAV